MRITVFGARGKVGRRVVSEALSRGHEVTAVVRQASQLSELPAAARKRMADAGSATEVAALSAGQDVVISATRPRPGNEESIVTVTRGLLDGAARAGVRVLIVGGAATLEVPGSGGKTVLEDTRYLPVQARPVAKASARQRAVCRTEEQADWTYLCPAAQLLPGERTGRYRLGTDQLLVDASGVSRISMEDLAVALIDEAERRLHRRQCFTVAY